MMRPAPRAMLAAAVALSVATSGCGGGDDHSGRSGGVLPGGATANATSPPATGSGLPTRGESGAALAAADSAAAARFGDVYRMATQAGASADEQGLIGENRRWGALYSPRFQLGSGMSLRAALAEDDLAKARAAFSAVEAGARAIRPDGYVPSSLPADQFPGAVLSEADIASAAAFFLAEQCVATLSLARDPRAGEIASAEARSRVEEALVRGARWLRGRAGILLRADAKAPNRLLYDALAFHGCGVLAGDAALAAEAVPFVTGALGQVRADGAFLEGGGSDTNYQAVSLRLAQDLSTAGYPGPDRAQVVEAWRRGAAWLTGKVRADGSIDSSANSRTCGGGESFLGRSKRVNPATVFLALGYAGTLTGDAGQQNAAASVASWTLQNRDADPCQ